MQKISCQSYPDFDNHECVVKIEDSSVGLLAFIAIHNSALGPATGGTRMFDYGTEEGAVADVLRLSRAMTYKCAAADVPHGGGKAVIMGDPRKMKTPALLRAFAKAVNELEGAFSTGTDAGITKEDVEIMREVSGFINGKHGGDPAPYAALGTFYGIQSALLECFGNADCHGRVVAIKGIGKVGRSLISLLDKAGAKIIAADIDDAAVAWVKSHFPSVRLASPWEIHRQRADVFCPCAMGGEISRKAAMEITARIVCGAANNQLRDPACEQILFGRGILYVPDFVANAGGLIHVVDELAPLGYDADRVREKINNIRSLLGNIFELARRDLRLPNQVAEEIAEKKFNKKYPASPLEIHENAKTLLDLYLSKEDPFWESLREKRTLELFHAAARLVPAYSDFLKKHEVNPSKIRTWSDFQKNVPVMDKKNYLRAYPLEAMTWGGTLKGKPLNFAATSGSTGVPFYFPRSPQLEWQCSLTLELFLRSSSFGTQGPIAVINAFSMGVWMGGMITFKAFDMINQRGHCPVSVLCTGNSKPAIFAALREWAPHFSEVILIGYPPFIKDVIDEGPSEGIDWSKIRLRLHFATESFSEEFRDYMAQKASLKNPYLDTMNIYGSADIGAMGFETPQAILFRKLIVSSSEAAQALFSGKTATLAQFNPYFINFEAPDKNVLLSGDNTIPLLRYSLGDKGGVLSYKDMTAHMDTHVPLWREEMSKAGIVQRYSLPFVYVYERGDLSVSLYGAKVYPETIRKVFLEGRFSDFYTGKFTLIVRYDQEQNQHLEVHVEQKKDAPRSDSKMLADAIVALLVHENAEYRSHHDQIPDKVLPDVILWPFGDPLHFGPNPKQQWIK
ncbi:MAG: hypothetical protein G01um101418_179 [Parcubacteria group bacterium Gr01-1014_18]|nr:MAG: hypothetical protein Greene041636_147 [Parcubacteria group bacterium Greene0416_36]TSC81339.1 MAG: hypothetical protein G01um101418_179 [Parcubacteria group bacterium Gr01-1014_18]TSC99475.1 MAG: hypothetical protein Greene101420_142 [Parcubacteria group bacterium Greene1014_20]TSD07606.1 MAG: hypothetical protein Greene07142_63 [Parcubacteria group bacterium Greene0714_2]